MQFDMLYEVSSLEAAVFGFYWIGPARFEHGLTTPVAVYHPTSADGCRALVFCTAWPARFFRIDVVSRSDLPVYSVQTGSRHGPLAAQIAEAISSGMLGFFPPN